MLKEALKVLFQRQNSEQIIRKCLIWTPQSMERIEDRDCFVHLFRHDHPELTLDQIKNIETLLSNNWMKGRASTIKYLYSKRESLFNVVLLFAEKVLLVDNDIPTCNYHHVIDWHILSMQLGEDLFTTALLAAYDAKKGRSHRSFLWPAYIKTKHPALEDLYDKPLTELHAHLKGSSLNFDLNWLSLMNQIQNRAEDFKQFGIRQHVQVSVGMDDLVTDLYHQVMKAASIRLYLFSKIKGLGKDVYEDMKEMLYTQSRLEATYCCCRLQEDIDCYRQTNGKRYYREDSGYDIVDYAINGSIINKDNDLLNSVLAGERELLYCLMKGCFDGSLSRFHEQLFIAYLIIKTRFRQEMVQLNEGVGFDNFATYEKRKTAFIKDNSVYDKLVAQLAVGSFLKDNPQKRYMEVRIVPEQFGPEVLRQVRRLDSEVHNFQFNEAKGWKFFYICHFIKTGDQTKDYLSSLVPRHHALREKVKRQAKAIYSYRNLNIIDDVKRVVAIDAANSEILTRPEVFAQAYRYLRGHAISEEVMYRPNDLRMTYHVGEDFMDVADGLRAYDEVRKFLRFGEGDRLGHALVLGVDVTAYYKKRNYVIVMPIQMILDNTVWLYEECNKLGDPYLLLPQLKGDYETYYRLLFGERMPIYTTNTYYDSWLLRGDNPFCYQAPSQMPRPKVSVDEWELNNLIIGDPEIDNARTDERARTLCCYYHFDSGVKKRGSKMVEYHITEAYVKTLELIRERKLKDAEARHLAIECNPTSNYKIGELNDFSEHPIMTFYNEGIKGNAKRHSISVSINTDDAGVFVTSIEREYAVMAKAMEDKFSKDKDITPKVCYDWLDDVRRFGLLQRFVK